MYLKTLTITGCLLLSTLAAHAGVMAEGAEEIRINGLLELNTAAGTAVAIEAGYGIFVADYVETGVFGGYGDDDYVTDIYGGLFGEYSFETDTDLIPFAGAQVRLIYAQFDIPLSDDSATGLAFGIYGGTKYFITDNVALSARLLIEAATDDIFADDDEQTNSNVQLDVGLRFFY